MQRNDVLKTAVEIIQRTYPDIKGIYVFGSFAKQSQTKDSDLDIAILPTHKIDPISLWNASQDIANALKKDIDLIDLSEASTVFQAQIITHGLRIEERNRKACEAFEDLVYAKYVRLNDLRETLLQDIVKRGTIH